MIPHRSNPVSPPIQQSMASRPPPLPVGKIKSKNLRKQKEDSNDPYEIRDEDPTLRIIREERQALNDQIARDSQYVPTVADPETQNEQYFLNREVLEYKLQRIALDSGLNGFGRAVCETISLAVQEYIRTFVDQLVRFFLLEEHLLI